MGVGVRLPGALPHGLAHLGHRLPADLSARGQYVHEQDNLYIHDGRMIHMYRPDGRV